MWHRLMEYKNKKTLRLTKRNKKEQKDVCDINKKEEKNQMPQPNGVGTRRAALIMNRASSILNQSTTDLSDFTDFEWFLL